MSLIQSVALLQRAITGRFRSSFHRIGHPTEMSNLTPQANNQFPRRDFLRLGKQPFRLHPFDREPAQR